MVKGRERVNGGVGARRAAAGSGDIAGAEKRRGLGHPSQERWSDGPRERREGPDRTELSLTAVGQRLHPGRARQGYALALAFESLPMAGLDADPGVQGEACPE
jgi:hypothetical protein